MKRVAFGLFRADDPARLLDGAEGWVADLAEFGLVREDDVLASVKDHRPLRLYYKEGLGGG